MVDEVPRHVREHPAHVLADPPLLSPTVATPAVRGRDLDVMHLARDVARLPAPAGPRPRLARVAPRLLGGRDRLLELGVLPRPRFRVHSLRLRAELRDELLEEQRELLRVHSL